MEQIFIVHVKTVNGNKHLLPISAVSEEDAAQQAINSSSLIVEIVGVDKNGK